MKPLTETDTAPVVIEPGNFAPLTDQEREQSAAYMAWIRQKRARDNEQARKRAESE